MCDELLTPPKFVVSFWWSINSDEICYLFATDYQFHMEFVIYLQSINNSTWNLYFIRYQLPISMEFAICLQSIINSIWNF